MSRRDESINPHDVQINTSPGRPSRKSANYLPAGGALTGALILVGLCCSLIRGCTGRPSPEQIRQRWIAEVTTTLNASKQQIFNSFHPTGTARQIVVHDVQGQSGRAGEPLLAVRYTIYWEGPITRDGFTKVLTFFDLESHRNVGTEILATNGITNEDAGQMIIDFTSGFLDEIARQEAARR